MRLSFGRKGMLGAIGALVAVGIGLMVLGAAGIAGWEYSNSDAFCASMCHSVHPEEIASHKTAAHARVRCVECHMGRNSTLKLIAMKPTHFKELWGMIVGYERPLHASGLRPANEACESCHYPQTEHHDKVRVIRRYAEDPQSSEIAYRLTLHTSADADREQEWKAHGIHWHITNNVQFKSLDVQGREIPWVQVIRPDGTTTTYVDPDSKVTPEQLAAIEPRRMECFNCHNAVGHPFPNPADRVDEAIAAGLIDRAVPSVKARAVAMIKAAGELSGPMEQRKAAVDRIVAENAAGAKVPAELKAKETQFQNAMRDILLASTFEEKGLTWQSFPNHGRHTDFPGCFRCHDGKHLTEKGESIRLQCTLCHDLPQVRLENGKGTVASTVVTGVTPPESHNEPNFMHEHRFKLDDSCSMCHGKLEFGREGGNFCANPACHGRSWPSVNLNVELKGSAPAPAPAATKSSAPAKADKARAETK